MNAGSPIYLLGLDFGSTTTSALVASASIVANSVTGHMELGNIQTVHRTKVIFTPFDHELIDEAAIISYLETVLSSSTLTAEDFMAGGVIITGLAARAENAARLTQIIEARIGEVLIATADDPCLESWLAFMGSCAALSRYHEKHPIVNLDIGGGTTNPAFGLNGRVLSNGCYFIGARHFQFVVGSYQIRALTIEARLLLQSFGIAKDVGDCLEPSERQRIIDCYLHALEAIALGRAHDYLANLQLATLEQVDFKLPIVIDTPPEITFSGGVGELVYALAAGETPLPTTYYGDFGVDLAEAIVASPILSRSLQNFVPENRGRATVYGLALHSTEVSGTTLYLPDSTVLPLRHLPILGQLEADDPFELFHNALVNLVRSERGGCLQIIFSPAFKTGERLALIRSAAKKLTEAIQFVNPPSHYPIVLLVDENIAKSFGAYITGWGALAMNLVVIDEIYLRDASFVNIGKPHKQVVPIAFYGMQ